MQPSDIFFSPVEMKDGKSGWVLVSPQREQDVAVPYNLDIDAIACEQRQPEG